MRRLHSYWSARLERLEAFLFSDAALSLKQLALSMLLLACMGWCSVLTERHFFPGLSEFVQDARRYDGTLHAISYAPLNSWEPGGGELIRTGAGFIPLTNPLPPRWPGEQVSIEGTWHSDGTLTPLRVLRHPDRKTKSLVSALTTVGLLLALTWRYGPWHRRSLLRRRSGLTASAPGAGAT